MASSFWFGKARRRLQVIGEEVAEPEALLAVEIVLAFEQQPTGLL
jgi:hypothetical protein